VADRLLVLTGPDAGAARKAVVDIGVGQRGLAVAQVGHHLELEVAAHPPAESRTHLADRERAGDRLCLAELETGIHLRDEPDDESVVAVWTLDEEAVLET